MQKNVGNCILIVNEKRVPEKNMWYPKLLSGCESNSEGGVLIKNNVDERWSDTSTFEQRGITTIEFPRDQSIQKGTLCTYPKNLNYFLAHI